MKFKALNKVWSRILNILFWSIISAAFIGPGTVLDADTGKGVHIIQFDDLPTPRKISFRAKLEKI